MFVPRVFASAARRYLRAYDAVGFHSMDSDGELFLLRKLRAQGMTVVFDVGANVGEWSRAVLEASPTADVHAFEVAPSTAKTLSDRLGAEPRCRINAYGLSDEEGTVTVRVGKRRTMSSFVASVPKQVAEEAGVVRTGDAYMREQGISHIDLLKIDAEGSDHLVLGGFRGTLEAGSIDVIQFEYGHFALQTRFLLADFHALLSSYGYAVGKLFPRGVEFRGYSTRDEDFRGLNYVAVLAHRHDLIALLSD